jgi:chromate transport protein ChrA
MFVGALASLVAMPTGVTALLRLGFGLSGVMLAHVCFAVSGSILMIGLALARRKQPLTSRAYWVTLALAALVIGVAGHLGSTVVYG